MLSNSRKSSNPDSADIAVDAAGTGALVRQCIDGDHEAMGRLSKCGAAVAFMC